MNTRLHIALNQASATAGRLRSALNQELPTDGSVPDWLELIPAGPTIRGVDGRTWTFGPEEMAGVLQEFARHLGELVLDWEHASEHRAPKGEDAPAAGWIKQLENRDGALWGRVEWTPRAAEQIANREYRYISPVFLFTADDDHRVVRLTSAGLTNQPNFALTALNQEADAADGGDADPNPDQGDIPTMDKELLKRLGLPDNATEAQVTEAIDGLKGQLETAQNRANQQPSLDKFVPRADYDSALSRAANAEERLTTLEKTRQDETIDSAINQALEDGKITPATVEYHKAQCRSEGGLDRFKAFVEQAPETAGDTGLDGKTPAGQDKALNAEMRAIAAQFGNSEEDLKQYGGFGDAS